MSQLYLQRTSLMLNNQDTSTAVQQALTLLILREELEREFGKNFFHKHGGDRKTRKKSKSSLSKKRREKSKSSLSDYISENVRMPKWAVAALLNFGNGVGGYALLGLQDYPKARELSTRSIQKINGAINEANLINEINNSIDESDKLRRNDQDTIKEAGRIAYEFIMKEISKDMPWLAEHNEALIQTAINRTLNALNEPREGGEHDPDPKTKQYAKPLPPKYRSVTAKDFIEIKDKFKIFHKTIRQIDVFVKTKKKLTKKEADGLNKMLQNISPAFTDFAISFIKTSTGK